MLVSLDISIVNVAFGSFVVEWPESRRTLTWVFSAYNIAYAAWASITPLLLIGLMPWSPWICVMFCAVMGAVGIVSAAYFGVRMPGVGRQSVAPCS